MRATLSVAFLFFLGKNRCGTDLCSNKIGGDGHKHHLEKKLLSGGFTLGGLNVRIYRRTFPSAIKYSEISWVGFTNQPSKVGISEGIFQRSWFRVERDLRKPTDQRKFLEVEHWQLNSRYREGYDRHDTVKGTRESVNTSVRTTDRSNIGSTALKKNKRW